MKFPLRKSNKIEHHPRLEASKPTSKIKYNLDDSLVMIIRNRDSTFSDSTTINIPLNQTSQVL